MNAARGGSRRSAAARWIALGAAAAPLVVGAPLSAAADQALADEAQAQLAEAVEQIEAVLADADASPDEKRARIGYRLRRWLDLAFISRAALGKHAEQFSREQYIEFAQGFSRFVVGTYVARIAREQTADFEMLGATWDPRTSTAIVRTRGGEQLPTVSRAFPRSPRRADVDYRMRKRHGEWRIVSISIGGVDMVRSFREQFDAVLGSEEPDELLRQLREHNARLEATNPFAA